MEHDLIAISAKCQKGEGIDTLNLLGIIHCLTGVFSEGRQILLRASSPTWTGRKAVNPSSQWDVKLSLLLSLMAPLPFWRWDSHSVSHFSGGDICYWWKAPILLPPEAAAFALCSCRWAWCSLRVCWFGRFITPQEAREVQRTFLWWKRVVIFLSF